MENVKFVIQALSVIATECIDSVGKIKCPKCGGDLHYQIHKNGHVWGKCKTDNFLSWMQ